MTFLQPILLWGLPLVLLPVLIHLINRVRHRPRPWAAMLFLEQAHRASTRLARLREWLIMACRMLALLALVLALARPVTGGWLGWFQAGAPDTVVILFDRSASMEMQIAGTPETRRQRALQQVVQAGKRYAGHTRFILLDSLTRKPHYLPTVAVLEDHALLAGTETSADLPALMQAAFEVVTRDHAGRTEVWMVSDLQAHDWRQDSPEWPSLAAKFRALPQPVAFRVLALDTPVTNNAAVRVTGLQRTRVQDKPMLSLKFEVRQTVAGTRRLPLTVRLDKQLTTMDLELASPDTVFQQLIPVATPDQPVWGSLELPADQNMADNRSFFACGPAIVQRTLVVAAQADVGRVLALAAAPLAEDAGQTVQCLTPEAVLQGVPKDVALIIWQAAVPPPERQAGLRAFVESGGVLLLLPPGVADSANGFNECSWKEPQVATAGAPWRVDAWNDDDGPLARTTSGARLRLDDLTLLRRQVPRGSPAAQVLATCNDGESFLIRQAWERGAVVACATLPDGRWSDLAYSCVLVPLVQRLAAEGLRHLDPVELADCGVPRPFENLVRLTAGDADAVGPAAVVTGSGVYQRGSGFLVLNRPAAEDVPDSLDARALPDLLPGLPLHEFHDPGTAVVQAQAEFWPVLVLVMLLALAGEGWLTALARHANAPSPRSKSCVRSP